MGSVHQRTPAAILDDLIDQPTQRWTTSSSWSMPAASDADIAHMRRPTSSGACGGGNSLMDRALLALQGPGRGSPCLPEHRSGHRRTSASCKRRALRRSTGSTASDHPAPATRARTASKSRSPPTVATHLSLARRLLAEADNRVLPIGLGARDSACAWRPAFVSTVTNIDS